METEDLIRRDCDSLVSLDQIAKMAWLETEDLIRRDCDLFLLRLASVEDLVGNRRPDQKGLRPSTLRCRNPGPSWLETEDLIRRDCDFTLIHTITSWGLQGWKQKT